MADRLLSGVWQGALLCFNCGKRADGPMPTSIDKLAARCRRFEKTHASCKPSPKGDALRSAHDAAFAALKKDTP